MRRGACCSNNTHIRFTGSDRGVVARRPLPGRLRTRPEKGTSGCPLLSVYRGMGQAAPPKDELGFDRLGKVNRVEMAVK